MGGYVALAGLMSEHPEVFAIRTFSRLHVRSLLYYQAELAELEKELESVELEDLQCAEAPRKDFRHHWKSLTATGHSSLVVGNKADSEDTATRLQWNLMLRIRETLREYDEAMMRFMNIRSSTVPANSTSMKRLRDWLESPEFGNSFISGKTEGVWDTDPDKNFDDFVVPSCGSEAVDGLTFQFAALITYLESFLKRKSQPSDKLHSVSSDANKQLNRAIVTTISSMFPVLPIIVLFFINRLVIRLILVLVFTVLFAFVLVFGLKIDSGKTLTVATAFAAIQVVFVGSTNSGLNSTSQLSR